MVGQAPLGAANYAGCTGPRTAAAQRLQRRPECCWAEGSALHRRPIGHQRTRRCCLPQGPNGKAQRPAARTGEKPRVIGFAWAGCADFTIRSAPWPFPWSGPLHARYARRFLPHALVNHAPTSSGRTLAMFRTLIISVSLSNSAQAKSLGHFDDEGLYVITLKKSGPRKVRQVGPASGVTTLDLSTVRTAP